MRTRTLNFDRLSAFVAVAQSGSFTAAAERLDMTKSALSQAVAALEKDLGIQLLQRSTRKLTVTEAGQTFLGNCQAFLAQAEQLMAQARSTKAQPQGTLRFSSPHSLAPRGAQWIAEYLRQYPHMRIDYRPTDEKLDLIEEGFDIGVRIGVMRDSRLHAVKLADTELRLVASKDYLSKRGVPKTPKDLSAHDWIAYALAPAPWTLSVKSPSGKTTRVRMQGAINVTAGIAQRALVLEGLGITVLPEWGIREDVTSGALKQLLPKYRLPEISFFAVYPGTVEPPAKTRAFIDIIKASMRNAG